MGRACSRTTDKVLTFHEKLKPDQDSLSERTVPFTATLADTICAPQWVRFNQHFGKHLAQVPDEPDGRERAEHEVDQIELTLAKAGACGAHKAMMVVVLRHT